MDIRTALGALRTTCETFDYSGTHLGERKVTATIQSATPIAFAIGDYVYYKEQYFFIQTMPVVTRVYSTLMLSYSLTFWWTGYELGLTKFFDILEDEPDKVYYSSVNEVFFDGTIKNLMDRIIANMNRTHPVTAYYNDSWHYSLGSLCDLDLYKSATFDDLYCIDVLQFVKNDFGLDFIFSPTRTILVGYSAAELNASAPLFEYGKDNGLCEINRLQNEQKVITRVYGFGSTRNIRPNYRTGIIPGEYHPRLMLPAPGYIEDLALIAAYGLREDTYTNDEIYPTIGVPEIVSIEPVLDRPPIPDPPITKIITVPAWIEFIPSGDLNLGGTIVHPEEVKEVVVPAYNYDTFTVYIHYPGFDLNSEEIKTGVYAKMAFTSGALQGQAEFTIVEFGKKLINTGGVITQDTDLYKVVMNREKSSVDYILPNSIVGPTTGDTFVFLDINLPVIYETDAEARLLVDTQAWFETQKKSPEGYSIKIPEEYIARDETGIVSDLNEGYPVQFLDTVIGAPLQAVTIQSLSISHKVNQLLPTYDLVISDTPIKGYVKKLENQLKSASLKIAAVSSNAAKASKKQEELVAVLKNGIIDNNGNIRGEMLQPQSVRNESLSAELKSRDYILEAFFAVNHEGDPNAAYGSTGVLQHKDDDIVWGGVFNDAHKIWTVSVAQNFTLETAKFYWVYIKGSLTDGTAIWVVSETRIRATDVEGYFMFEWGNIVPVRDGIRYSQNAHGINGISSYVYIAYASSDAGADFTLVNDPLLAFMAIKSSATEIVSPVVGDFAGLWFRRIPEGAVVGPVSSVNDHIVAFDGTSGKLLKDTGKTISELALSSVYPATGLTTGYIPYKSSTVLSNSPVYTDGTKVRIGTTTSDAKFKVISSSATDGGVNNYVIKITANGANTANIGLYVGCSGATNNYALYSASGQNYFSGAVGLGTVDFGTHKLSVIGTSYFSSDVIINSLASAYARLISSSPTGQLTAIADGTDGQVLKTNGAGTYSFYGITDAKLTYGSANTFSNDRDIVDKAYVDAVATGNLPKLPVDVATTVDITLSGTQTIDTYSAGVGARVLVWNQSTPSQNGIYIVASGAWTRATDLDTWAELYKAYVAVLSGSQAGSSFVCTIPSSGTLESTDVTWVLYNVPTNILAGTGLTKTGNTIALNVATGGALGGIKIGTGITITDGVASVSTAYRADTWLPPNDHVATTVVAANGLSISGQEISMAALWEGIGYLTAITKAMIEAELTGEISSHTHAYLASILKGAINGVAELDGTGKVPLSQLPAMASQNITFQTLSGTTPAWNAVNGVNAELTISGATTITLSNLVEGTSGTIVITNPATQYSLSVAGYTNVVHPAIGVITDANRLLLSGGSKVDIFSWKFTGSVLIWNGGLSYIT